MWRETSKVEPQTGIVLLVELKDKRRMLATYSADTKIFSISRGHLGLDEVVFWRPVK